MTVLIGADSSSPQPTQYEGKKVWGVYIAGATPHIWTKEEVAELGAHGVEGVMPIVVPPQDVDWWSENYGYATLEAMAREALAWGLPEGSPLCLDIEEAQSTAIIKSGSAADVMHAWAVATRVHNLRTWTYGPAEFLAHDHWALLWLASWPEVTPESPELPAGYQGWQYRGGVDGIDLDIFEEGRDYLSPDLKVVTIPTPVVVPETVDNAVAKVEAETQVYEESHDASPDVSRETSEVSQSPTGAEVPAAIPDATPPTTDAPSQVESAPVAPTPATLMEQLRSVLSAFEAWFTKESPKS